MINLFKKYETDKYIIIKILFIKISIRKKSSKSDIDFIARWIPFRSLRDAIKNIYYQSINLGTEIQKEIYITRQLYSKLLIENKFNNSNNLPLVSIIIPVYNIGEKYLRQCLESVINQSYKNIEIIIVNDCSVFEEDEKIILEYASKDNRIKYIKHKENMGDGAARMTGLKEAKGYSVLFADGDDYMSLDLIEIAIFEMIKNNVDIVCYNFFVVREENNKIEFNDSYYKNIPYQVLYGESVIELFCNLNNNIGWNLWNKLFKREILLELGFNNIPLTYRGKDLNYFFKILSKSKSMVYIPLNLYFYIENRNNSITNINKLKDNYFTDIYYIFLDMFDFLNKEQNEQITKLFAMNLIYLYYNALDFDRREAREENHFINIFKKVILDLIDYGAIDKEKLLENVKNITNDKNLINWLANIQNNNIDALQKSYGIKIINFTNKSYNEKTIALYFDAGIGDYLMLRPLLPFIREYYKNCKLIFIGNNRFKDVISYFDKDYIDEYIYYDGDIKYEYNTRKDFFKNICYDVLISPYFLVTEYLQNNLSLIKAKEKIASFGGLLTMSQRQRVKTAQNYTKIIYPNEKDMFELYRNIEFFEQLFNQRITINDISINLKEEDFKNVDFNFNERYAIIFPSATDINRQWDYKNFQFVCEHIYKKYKMTSYIVGGEGDKELANKIIGNRKYIISICGKYKLHEVFYIFNKSKIVVTNDSGGYHIAMSVSDNVIVIFSGANFIRFIDYPKQFKENKIISTPIPDKAKEFKYIEYYYDRDFLNTISAKSICDLIDEKHYTKLM
ncbi:glycosyltransferase [Brachyspira aalborgi]|uniref:glycosyltransferase n=1 Tax=Brachyspira aalborgi TaxID=29522 RepID=UPI00266BF822|nr:glycosyltransferase [Brachyspira aalborgi]